MTIKKIYIFLLLISMVLTVLVTVYGFSSFFNFNETDVKQDLPLDAKVAFEKMHASIENAKRVLVAEQNQLLYVDSENRYHEYVFEYGMIWHNEYPVVQNVAHFNFEYRDQYGYHLVSTRNHSTLFAINYTIRFNNDQNNYTLNHRMDVSHLLYARSTKHAASLAFMTTMVH